jgi:hypothetical protein
MLEDPEFQASLGYIVNAIHKGRDCPKVTNRLRTLDTPILLWTLLFCASTYPSANGYKDLCLPRLP